LPCGTEGVLTPEQVRLIRQHIENNRSFRIAESTARLTPQGLQSSCNALLRSLRDALPRYLKVTSERRHKDGFTVERIYEILGEEAKTIVDSWLVETRALSRAAAALHRYGPVTIHLRCLIPPLTVSGPAPGYSHVTTYGVTTTP
jgi:hypothetical protein